MLVNGDRAKATFEVTSTQIILGEKCSDVFTGSAAQDISPNIFLYDIRILYELFNAK